MTRTIKVETLARVEGEGSLIVKLSEHELVDVKLKIYEPPRFFEGFLRGRRMDEAPDITARICGICPIAYQLSSSTALESALGIRPGGQIRELRRLIYCGEWIESHALHIHLLHTPDFLGFEDAIRMAAVHPDPVKRGLRLKKLGNRIMTVVGGREVHPVNLRVGGFYSAPKKADLVAMVPDLERALADAVDTAHWVSTFPFPDFEPDTEYVAMVHPDEYPLFEGRLASTRGLNIAIEEFEEHFVEVHEQHAHALHCRRKDGGCYQVGPIARYNLNRQNLTPVAAQTAKHIGLEEEVRNPFRSIQVRAIELIFAFEEALRIIAAYEPPSPAWVDYKVAAGEGCGCSEAPRGLCYHRYRFDDQGILELARIVPPTSQNQARIEQDLREYIPDLLALDDEQIKWRCEHAVRNYDPCISCATHFLRLEVDRG